MWYYTNYILLFQLIIKKAMPLISKKLIYLHKLWKLKHLFIDTIEFETYSIHFMMIIL